MLVWRLDRLSRSLRDGIDILCRWQDAGVRVVSVSQGIDLSGSVGKLIASVLLALAEIEFETMRQRQRVGIEAAKKRGAYRGGHAPGSTKGSPGRALALRAKGLSVGEIAQRRRDCHGHGGQRPHREPLHPAGGIMRGRLTEMA